MKSLTIRKGSVRVRIFTSRTTVAGKVYTRYEVRWTDHHGRRHRLKRSKLAEAKKEATRLAEDLARGHHRAELSLADLASFRAGIVNLYGLGKTIEVATSEYAELKRMVPDVAFPELGKFWLAHRPRTAIHVTVEEAICKFLNQKKQKGISRRWEQALTSQLNRFKKDFQCKISEVTPEQINHWFLNLPGVNARSRNNYLAAVQNLFSLPELADLPSRRGISELTPCKESAPRKLLWRPEEFRKLLETALLPFTVLNKRTRQNETRTHEHLIPVLALGGFCKLRSESEVMRAVWENMRLNDKQLVLEAEQTKTEEMRMVSLPNSAVAWLRLCARPAGRIWPWAANKLHADLRALAARCELTWRPNALRKSANTYAMLLKPNVGRVSQEAGNSPDVLQKNYLNFNGVTRADAKAWFAIVPPEKTQKIVPLQASVG